MIVTERSAAAISASRSARNSFPSLKSTMSLSTGRLGERVTASTAAANSGVPSSSATVDARSGSVSVSDVKSEASTRTMLTAPTAERNQTFFG